MSWDELGAGVGERGGEGIGIRRRKEDEEQKEEEGWTKMMIMNGRKQREW